MSTTKKDPNDAVKMTSGLDDQMQADLDEVMRKYDRESNTRVWEGWQRWVVGILMVAFSLYCIGMTLFFSGLPETRLAAFLAMIVFIGFLTYPVKKGHVKVNSMPWYDIVLMLVGTACFLYFAFNALPIIKLATRIQTHHVIIGAIGILVLIELCRRCVGVPILCVLGALLVYTFYNQLSYNPSLYQALKNVVYKLFYTTNGVIGTPINVCYTYIVLFIYAVAKKLIHKRFELWCLAAITGGAIGNLIDRVQTGLVVDMICIPWFSTFNVADIFITFGAILMVLYILIKDKEFLEDKPKKSKEQGNDAETGK